MKKIIITFLLVFTLIACGEQDNKKIEVKNNTENEKINKLENNGKTESNDKLKVYLENNSGEQKVILEKNGKKKEIYKSIKNKIVKDIIINGIIDDGLLSFTQNMWEGQVSYLYNIKTGKIVHFDKGDYEGITKNKKYFYSCKSSDMSKGHFLVYDMDLNLIKNINSQKENIITNCYDYDNENNSISYNIGEKKETYFFNK